MGLFRKKSIIGLEIDEPEIRLAEILLKGDKKNLNTARISLEDLAVKEGIIKNPEAVGKTLGKLWRENAIKNKKVVLGISNQNIMVRFAEFPKLPENKLANIIKNQAGEFLPVDINKVVIDFNIINEINSESEARSEVLIVAAISEMIETFLKALKLAKIKPLDIEPSILSLHRIIPQKLTEETIAIIIINNSRSNILICDAGVPKLARILSTGVNQLNTKTFEKWVDDLTNEIYSTVSYYQSQGATVPPVALYICGEGAKIKGITNMLQDILNVPVKFFNPLERFNIELDKDKSIEDIIQYSTCIALACRELEA